jgi:DNA invertase Pin-like site-specific DNA recombinase
MSEIKYSAVKYIRLSDADDKRGKINCVMTRDLSRFGREYIETGRYLRRILPAYGVRFIAINDNY